VKPGQRLFLFTGGMMSAGGDADSPFTPGGLEVLKKRLNLHGSQPIQQIVDSVTRQTIADTLADAGSTSSRDLLLIGLEC